uniref:Uncharacterized protein n=1 Tax=Hucho hucho TaxID=62062 RepID=A0A4W5JXK6_9TELE
GAISAATTVESGVKCYSESGKEVSSSKADSALGLDDIKTHHWCIIGCSAVTGENLLTGVDWLLDDIAARVFTAD